MERLIEIKQTELNPTLRALSDAGVTLEDAAWIRQGTNASLVEDFIRRQRSVLSGENVIDCDAAPFKPKDWEVVAHQKGGKFTWDATKVVLHLEPEQVSGTLVGTTLRKRLARKRKLNANVLDHLLKNPHLIPEAWKGKCIFFWGTVYRSADRGLCVRYLSWDGSSWGWSYDWVDGGWGADDPCAVAS